MRGFIIALALCGLSSAAVAQGTITTIHPSAPQQPTAISGPSGYLAKSNNLSDISNAATARTNLGLPALFASKAGDTFTGPIVARQQNVLTGAVTRSTAPSSAGNWNSISTAFTGDLSTVSNAVAHTITGTATLGQPATGYYYQNEAYPNLVYVYNSSGWNQSTSGNDGRTAAVAQKVQLFQHGQGDMVGLNVNGFVDSTRSGATSWLASPNITIVNGTLQAGVAGAFLNGSEMDLVDSGFDVSGITLTSNLNRTNNTGALGTYWGFLRGQSIGSKPVDDFLSATGPWNRGLNFAYTNFGTNQAAIVTAQSQRWYGNAVGSDPNGLNGITLGTDWVERSQYGFWNFVYNNASAFQINDTQVTALPAFQANKGVNVSPGYSYQINGTSVLGANGLTLSPALSGSASLANWSSINVATDTVTPCAFCVDLNVTHHYQSLTRGARNAIFGWMIQDNAATTGSSATVAVGLTGIGQSNAGDGGTNLTNAGVKGTYFGANVMGRNAGTNVQEVVGIESDLMTTGASSARYAFAYTAANYAAAQGSALDAAFGVYSGGSVNASGGSGPWGPGLGFHCGICFAELSNNGLVPLDSGATVLGTHLESLGTIPAAHGIDLSGFTFSVDAFKSNLFSVSQGGTVFAQSYWANGALSIDGGTGAHVIAKKTAAQVLAITCNAGAEGYLLAVTDANSAVFNAAIASGGANHVMAYCNGSSWTVH